MRYPIYRVIDPFRQTLHDFGVYLIFKGIFCHPVISLRNSAALKRYIAFILSALKCLGTKTSPRRVNSHTAIVCVFSTANIIETIKKNNNFIVYRSQNAGRFVPVCRMRDLRRSIRRRIVVGLSRLRL